MSIPHDYYNLDMDRLHRTIEHPQRCARGEGKTMGIVANMVGEAHLGDFGNVYLYVGENAEHSRDVARTVATILDVEGFSVTHENPGTVRTTLFVGNSDHLVKCFWFVGSKDEENLIQYVRGNIFDDIYIDVSFERWNQTDPAIWSIVESRRR